MTLPMLVALDALVWGAWSAIVGYGFHRLPASTFASDGAVTRLRAWERSGHVYERLGIRRWKDRLPEAGAWFRAGVSKRSIGGRTADDVERFAAETRRAEHVHWTIPVIAPLFVLWNPGPLFAAMVVYALVANVPCVMVQRYNRARIERGRRRRRLASSS